MRNRLNFKKEQHRLRRQVLRLLLWMQHLQGESIRPYNYHNRELNTIEILQVRHLSGILTSKAKTYHWIARIQTGCIVLLTHKHVDKNMLRSIIFMTLFEQYLCKENNVYNYNAQIYPKTCKLKIRMSYLQEYIISYKNKWCISSIEKDKRCSSVTVLTSW